MNLKLLFLCAVSHICNATVLVKFGKVPLHYLRNWKKGSATTVDPFEDYGLERRQRLCDDAINARQFMLKYAPSYYKKHSGRPLCTLTTWDPLNTVLDRTLNFQRCLASSSDPDPEWLKPQKYSVMVYGESRYAHVKAIACVNTMNVKWYLTFGWVENFMYLLENCEDKTSPHLRVTGIFEPPAIVANLPPAYFRKRFKASMGMMESYCRLGSDDYLRLCGVVFDTLYEDDNKTHKNYVQKYFRFCALKYVKVSRRRKVFTRVIRCTIFSEKEQGGDAATSTTTTTHFCVLPDPREKYAVFVLYGNDALKLKARVTGIGALMNPVDHKMDKARETRKNRSQEESDKEDETDVEFEAQARADLQKRKRRKLKMEEPTSKRSKDETESENESEEKIIRRRRSRRRQKRKSYRDLSDLTGGEGERHLQREMTISETIKNIRQEKVAISAKENKPPAEGKTKSKNEKEIVQRPRNKKKQKKKQLRVEAIDFLGQEDASRLQRKMTTISENTENISAKEIGERSKDETKPENMKKIVQKRRKNKKQKKKRLAEAVNISGKENYEILQSKINMSQEIEKNPEKGKAVTAKGNEEPSPCISEMEFTSDRPKVEHNKFTDDGIEASSTTRSKFKKSNDVGDTIGGETPQTLTQTPANEVQSILAYSRRKRQ